MKTRAIIVDDEPGARESLKNILQQWFPAVEVLGMAESLNVASRMIRETEPDLVFLDIEMPGGGGFDLLERLGEFDFQVIFVTAYDHYAIKAIRFSALDYLLKPVDMDELRTALDRLNKKEKSTSQSTRIKSLLSEIRNPALKKLIIPDSEGMQFLDLDQIVRCESDGNYTCIHLTDGKKLVSSKTLGDYDDMLNESGFYRIHRSHLINTKFIRKYVRGEGGSVIMADGTEVEVSRRKKTEFLDYMAAHD